MQLQQPSLISQYNLYMGGVDRANQNISLYRTRIRGRKWWWSIFAWLVDASIHNAWQLSRIQAKDSKTDSMDYLAFRRYVAQTYLKQNVSSEKPIPCSRKSTDKRVLDSIRYDKKDHIVIKSKTRIICAECKMKTSDKCEKCNVGLHSKCFKAFHTQK